jgi:pimeloyl-ACP methyl ester carboxylesterase
VTELSWQTLQLTLRARQFGPDNATTLIGLHGFLDTGASFHPVAEALSDQWRLVIPDHRGHGDSDHLGSGGYYHFPDYLLDLDGLYRRLGIDEAVLMGHSMGASIACYFAGPPTSLKPENAPKRIRRWIRDVRDRQGHQSKGAASLETIARRIARLSPRAEPERLRELATHASAHHPDGHYHWKFDPLHRTQAPLGFDAQRFLHFLEAIACPVLLMWAEESPMHATDESARIAALGDVQEVTIAATGHNLHHERPMEVAKEIRRFLSARGL